MASETGTKRVTGATWVDLEVSATICAIQNMGTKTTHIAVDTSAPSDSTYLGMKLEGCCDPIYITLESGDKVYARVYSAQDEAKTTIAWHAVDPPA